MRHLITQFARVGIIAAPFLLIFVPWALSKLQYSQYFTNEDRIAEQPVAFSHAHHVSGLGIDCRFCHVSVDNQPYAGLPSAKTCMTCHSQVYTEQPVLRKLRRAYEEGRQLDWQVIYDLPQYVYFHHAVHINRGFSCQRCHGSIETMPLTRKATNLTMSWCLDCHHTAGEYSELSECYRCHR